MAGVEVTWLVLLPAILGCAVVLTDMAHNAIQRYIKPKACPHPFVMAGRCGKCGTPL